MSLKETLWGTPQEIQADKKYGELSRIREKRKKRKLSPKQEESFAETLGLSRRLFLRRLVTVLGGAVLASSPVGAYLLTHYEIFQSQVVPPELPAMPPLMPETENVFSGETEETEARLVQWEQEIGADFRKNQEMLPLIGNLAIAYFSKQMGYDRERFAGKIHWVDQKGLFDAYEEAACVRREDRQEIRAFVPWDKDAVYFNVQTRYRPAPTENFGIILHELHHLASPPKRFSVPKNVVGIPKPVVAARGVGVYTVDDARSTTFARECVVQYRGRLEEAVVDDSVYRMFLKLNIVAHGDNDLLVQKYRQLIIDPLYRGNNQELLSLHQQTEEGFFQSIGRSKGGKTSQEQIEFGSTFVENLFNR